MTSKLVWAAVAAAALWLGAQPAFAQFNQFPDRGQDRGFNRDSIVLFDGPGFNGRPFPLNQDMSNLSPTGFNDRAGSVQVRDGDRWELCEHANFRGRCVMVDRDVYDLSQIGLINQVSSLRRVGGQRPPNFAFKPPAPGESAVFYPTPRNRRGEYVRACGFRGDDDRRCAQEESVRFCREMGHRDAAFSQTRGGYLIDVLCVR